jgi:hypothetical protein
MAELLASDVDILTGDYLAELTMLVLSKNQSRGGHGYVDAFVEQLRHNAADIAASGVKVITNAGGLNPRECAAEIRAMFAAANLDVKVAAITGDDVRAAISDGTGGFANIDSGESLAVSPDAVLTANAYLGCWPIARALDRGADIVVCPRTTDASLVVGAAAWHFSWAPEDYDRLAGAVIAGHVIECGTQATGGNYSFFGEVADRGLPGMPIADIAEDGSATISKSAGSGGLVSVDTVKAQLFYEIGSAAYQNPDVVADLSSVHLASVREGQVDISAAKGFPPTDTLKVSLTYEAGYRNSMTIGLTGGAIPEKVSRLDEMISAAVGSPDSFDGYRRSVIGPADPGGSYEEATAWYVVTVKDANRGKVDRANFSDRLVGIATASIPGYYMTTPPQRERLFGVQWPTLIAKDKVTPLVHLNDEPPEHADWQTRTASRPPYSTAEAGREPGAKPNFGPQLVQVQFGTVFGTRSGDKAGIANLGVWARSELAYQWLRGFLSAEQLVKLVPEAAGLRVERHPLSNLWGVNFLIFRFLEDGVSSSTRIDPQAKGLGEYLGGRLVSVPAELIAAEGAR